MKNVSLFLAAAAVAASLAVPASAADFTQSTHEFTPPLTAPSLFQWQAMAAAEADTLAPQLQAQGGPWHVKAADGNDSRFARSFTTMLTSELAARGVQLTTRDSADSVIEVQVEGNNLPFNGGYKPGTLTKLAAGLWVVKGVTHAFNPAVAATALAVGTDYLLSQEPSRKDTPGAELAVTLVATKGDVVAASHTSVYVLNMQGFGAYYNTPGRVLKFSK